MYTLLHGLFLLFKGLIEALFDWLFDQLFYAAGWLMLRLLTLGRYPRLPLSADAIGPRSSWVTAFGLLCVVGLPLATLVLLYG
ncbi:MAG: hypothetical protein AAAB13_20000 [Pseudomonas sp.]